MVVTSYCSHVLWIRQQSRDQGINLEPLLIKCNNTNTINLSRNLIQHSRAKHIYIRHHFNRGLVQNKVLKNLLIRHIKGQTSINLCLQSSLTLLSLFLLHFSDCFIFIVIVLHILCSSIDNRKLF